MAVIELTMDNYMTEVKESDKPVVIDFYADWCGPCKMMAPVFHQLSDDMGEVKFAKCNVDENPALAMQFNVQTIPNIVITKNGETVGRSIGFVSKDELEDTIKGAMNS